MAFIISRNMRKILHSFRTGRPSVLLGFILAICLCYVITSLHFLHIDDSKVPFNVLQTKRSVALNKPGRLLADDSSFPFIRKDYVASQKPTPLKVSMGLKNLPFLNEIDIDDHINVKSAKGKAKLKKEDLWPSHEKKQYKYFLKAIPVLDPNIFNNQVRTRQDWGGKKYIVYLCHKNITCAGWGDRQHGIFSAYLLSLVTNRTFKVIMDTPCPIWKLYHYRLLNWKVNESELVGLTSVHINALNSRAFRESTKVMDFNEKYPQDVVYLTTNYDYYYTLKVNPLYKNIFKQKVRGRPRPILFADLWQTIFKFNKRVVRKYTKSLIQARPTKTHKLVCAHIRFGRNPTIPTDSDVRNTLDTIKPLWPFLENHSDASKFRLFVASDWQGFRSKVINMYPNITIDIEGDVVHIDKIGHRKENSTNSTDTSLSDPCNGFEKVIADQHVLSKCDVLLLTYSVFGKAAAYLRRSNNDLYLMENGTIKPLKMFDENKLLKRHHL